MLSLFFLLRLNDTYKWFSRLKYFIAWWIKPFGIRRFDNRHVRHDIVKRRGTTKRLVFCCLDPFSCAPLRNDQLKKEKLNEQTVQVNTNILRNSRSFRAEKGIVLGENRAREVVSVFLWTSAYTWNFFGLSKKKVC